MEPMEFAEIAKALAWPLTFIAFVVVFYKRVRALLERLAATLTLETVKLKVFGLEVQLAAKQAKETFDELLQIIVESTNELPDKDIALFDRIKASAGSQKVGQLFPEFQRDTPERPSPEHRQLQNLRDRMLIRPLEGESWQAWKHPVLTRFGQLVSNLGRRPNT